MSAIDVPGPIRPSLAARAAYLAAVRGSLPGLRLLTDEVDRESYRRDETAYLEPPLPIARGAADDDGRGRRAGPAGGGPPGPGRARAARARAERRRGRRRRWPDDRLHPDGPRPRDRPRQPGRGDPAGRRQRGPQEGRRGRGPVLRARPGQLRDVHDRRQPRHERRRPVLRQVRRDPRLGPRAGDRDGRRVGRPARRADDQGRRRVRPDPAHRRQPGNARDRHRGDPPAAPDAPAQGDPDRLLPDPRRRGSRRRGDDPMPASSRAPSS